MERARDRIAAVNLSLHISEWRLLLALGDIACWLAVALVFGHHRTSGALVVGLGASLLVWCVSAWVNGAYDVETASRPASIVRAIAQSAVVVGVTFGLTAYFAHGSVGRVEWVASFAAAILLIVLWRLSALWLFTLPMFTRRLLFAGIEPITQELASLIRQSWSPQLIVVGFIHGPQRNQPADSIGGLGAAVAIATSFRVSEIVVGQEAIEDPRNVSRLVDCMNAGFKLTPSPMLYEELLRRVPVTMVDHRWILELARGAFADRTYLSTKRLIDILLATLGLALLTLAFPFVAAAILLESGRPILYRQERVGSRGGKFTLLKFRTMRQDAECGSPQWALPGDSRITRVGRFLRRSRIDELPQVLNILSGQMSVVGPRPERPEFVQRLAREIPFYNTRHTVKPGLTGWAQINQGYGASVDDARIKLEYDLYYVRRQSLSLDALIVLRTIGIVLHLRGR